MWRVSRPSRRPRESLSSKNHRLCGLADQSHPTGSHWSIEQDRVVCLDGVITNRNNELTSCDNRESWQDRWQSNCRVNHAAGTGSRVSVFRVVRRKLGDISGRRGSSREGACGQWRSRWSPCWRFQAGLPRRSSRTCLIRAARQQRPGRPRSHLTTTRGPSAQINLPADQTITIGVHHVHESVQLGHHRRTSCTSTCSTTLLRAGLLLVDASPGRPLAVVAPMPTPTRLPCGMHRTPLRVSPTRLIPQTRSPAQAQLIDRAFVPAGFEEPDELG